MRGTGWLLLLTLLSCATVLLRCCSSTAAVQSGLRGWTVLIAITLAFLAIALVFGLEIHRFFRYIGVVDSDLTQRPTKTA